jgi:hypothetical protein
LSQYR